MGSGANRWRCSAMKIKSIDVKVLKVPLDQPYTAAGRAVGANWHVMAEITTEEGATGFGSIVALNQMFIASDGFWYSLSLDDLAASARRALDVGFRAVKLRVGNERHPDGEVARVKAVRDAVGPSVSIMTDATESWSVDRAIRTGKALQEAGVVWIEDPVSHTDVSGMARVAAALDADVATGEHLYRITDFTRLLEARGTGIALIDLGRIGGVTPWRHVASLAHGFGVPVGGDVVPEIHVHLLCAIPNARLVEYVPRSAALLRKMPAISDGALIVPEGGGFGLQLDHDAVRRFTV